MSQIVNIHTHRLRGDSGIEVLSIDYQLIYEKVDNRLDVQFLHSLAIHPMDYQELNQIDFVTFQQTLQETLAVAIGEIGFDRQSELSTSEQQVLFKRITEISQHTELPIIIHCVGRWNELEQALLKKPKGSPAWIVHGFRKTNVGNRLLELGAYLSFGEALLYDVKLQEFVKNVSFDRIFLETDDSDVQIITVYEKLAEIKCLPLQSIIDQLYSNYLAVFHHEQLA